MRRRRVRRPDNGFKAFAIMFFLMVVIAMGTAYLGTKYILYPYILDKKDAAETGASDEKNTSSSGISKTSDGADTNASYGDAASNNTGASEGSLSLMNIYYPQLGNFTQKENALKLIEQLKADGIFAYIIETEGRYKAVMLPCIEHAQAEERVAEIIAYSSEAFVMNRQIDFANRYSADFARKVLSFAYQLSKNKTVAKDEIAAVNKEIKEIIDANGKDKNNEIECIKRIYEQMQKISGEDSKALMSLQNTIAEGIEQMI